jgi:hypothetical protein
MKRGPKLAISSLGIQTLGLSQLLKTGGSFQTVGSNLLFVAFGMKAKNKGGDELLTHRIARKAPSTEALNRKTPHCSSINLFMVRIRAGAEACTLPLGSRLWYDRIYEKVNKGGTKKAPRATTVRGA